MQQARVHNKNLQLVETLQIGNGKYVQIVKAGEVYLVIAVGKEEVSVLAQLTKEQLTELPETVEPPPAKQFKDILEKFKEQKKG
jgi:flagellar protein FliO/FliZ